MFFDFVFSPLLRMKKDFELEFVVFLCDLCVLCGYPPFSIT